MSIKVSGAVILYNPDNSILDNINSYIEFLDILYIVDNSEEKDNEILNKVISLSNKCKYIDNKGNKGISYALNIAANLAMLDNADWLLTMDQDSRFEDKSLSVLIDYICNNNTNDIGIISPYHLTRDKLNSYIKKDEVISRLSVMTSGNLLNLNAYSIIGKFDEDFFIDFVDHEYCLRLNSKGYVVKVHLNSFLIHDLGDIQSKIIFGKKIIYTNHNKIRRYYITRNRLIVMKRYFTKYPKFCFKNIKNLISEWMKIIFFEKNKIEKQIAILMGIRDFILSKGGKINF